MQLLVLSWLDYYSTIVVLVRSIVVHYSTLDSAGSNVLYRQGQCVSLPDCPVAAVTGSRGGVSVDIETQTAEDGSKYSVSYIVEYIVQSKLKCGYGGYV